MPSSLLRAGFTALRERSVGALAALTGGASSVSSSGGNDDVLLLEPLGPQGWASLLRTGTGPASFTDVRRLLFYAAACMFLMVLVSVTKPDDASFRTYLTELAFRRHIAHIRSSDEPEAAIDSLANPSAVSTSIPPSRSSSGADTPTIAPFRFANHVAISLRTPSLCYRSYFFFALAFAAPAGPPAYLSDPVPPKKQHTNGAPLPDPIIAYLGILGHWFILGQVPQLLQWAWRHIRLGRRDKVRKKSSIMDRPGVMEMRAVFPKDEVTPQTARSSTLVPKLLFKNESYKDLTEVLPLHSQSTALSTNPLAPLAAESQSRRGSIVNLIATPPTPPSEGQTLEVNSPVLIALKAELVTAQNLLTDLQAQLQTHEESVTAAQAHLQNTLDELRQRRKDDDAERQDLKAKSKVLEDQKRQAESARRDAEKRLKAAETQRDGLLSKIASVGNEIEDLKGNMELSNTNIQIVKEEGTRHLEETRKAGEEKHQELSDLEKEVAELETTNNTLSKQVREAEDQLKTAETALEDARKIAPEEEMMLMAAAYEAAASEGYHQGQADNQWASQAAAYMAEAGMPYLDQTYTARPTQSASSGYGHLARGHPNSSSVRSLAEKRGVDLPGFEDFGPGVGGGHSSRSLAAQRKTTPSGSNLGVGLPSHSTNVTIPATGPSDVEEQGSSLGTMTPNDLLDNWLPQGLVRSLEGDVTPLEGAGSVADPAEDDDDGLLSTLHDALRTGPGEGDSGSDDSFDDVVGTGAGGFDDSFGSHNGHRGTTQASRFVPNVSPPHPGSSTSSLPVNNTAVLPSRRWFSTSPSPPENASPGSFNLFQPSVGAGSNDSLPLSLGGYEALFAPSASEKRALKWPLLSKARWTGNGGRSISGLDEITANLKDDASAFDPAHAFNAFGSARQSPPKSANGLSAEELFNRVPAPPGSNFEPPTSSMQSLYRPVSSDSHTGGAGARTHGHAGVAVSPIGRGWLPRHRPAAASAPGVVGATNEPVGAVGAGPNPVRFYPDEAADSNVDPDLAEAERDRKSFRFFSLRGGKGTAANA